MKIAIVLAVVAWLCVARSEARSVSSSPAQSLEGKDKEVCKADTTPCGWEIYHPITRSRLHIVQNTSCKCASDHKCVKAQDDISQSTYIYKCRTAFPTNLT